jgi:hypothetical protein
MSSTPSHGTLRRLIPSHGTLRWLIEKVKRFLKREPEPPDDPYAMVGAPKKPRTPRRSAAASAPLD